MSDSNGSAGVRNVVLVHGGFVDGSGWQGIYKALKKDGYTVAVVQNPTLSLADDVTVTKRAIAAQNGPVILVGHSYGGAVITEAGNHPNVAGLVYVAAFAPDKGESVNTLIKDPPPGAPVPPILPPQDGFSSSIAEVPRLVCRRREPRRRRLHGRFPVPVGSGGARRRDHRAGMEDEAHLVRGRDRRQDDSARRSALAGQARRGPSHRVKGSHSVYVCPSRRPWLGSSRKAREALSGGE